MEAHLPTDDVLRTVNDQARRHRVSHTKIRSALRSGELKAIRLPKSTWPRIFDSDMLAWLRGMPPAMSGDNDERADHQTEAVA